ncbi:hypothetical protein K501DRAFT_332228 [Backusella circina FSU 941]|nr:hypothetical protein K501DRAFT_332228 [Backusella circina FSU 941]
MVRCCKSRLVGICSIAFRHGVFLFSMVSARGISRSIGITFGFIGMVGLVLSIVSLLPLNGYNIYISVDGLLQVIRHELERTSNDWTAFSLACKLYIVYFTGTVLCSALDFCLFMLVCCGCRKQQVSDEEEDQEEAQEEEEEQMIEQRQDSNDNGEEQRRSRGIGKRRGIGNIKAKKSTLFNRVSCFILILQIAWALFGTHLYFYLSNDDIPATIGVNLKTSLCILWLNYLTLTLFAIILFCASFFILLGGKKTRYQGQPEETRPLIL